MHLDYTVPWLVALVDFTVPVTWIVALVLQTIGLIVSLLLAWRRIERSIDSRFHDFSLLLKGVTDGDIRELRASVQRLETGQDEWTKTLRQRTHDLSDEVNVLKLKVDRLERPGHYPRVAQDSA